jgi:hypothetical protein
LAYHIAKEIMEVLKEKSEKKVLHKTIYCWVNLLN